MTHIPRFLLAAALALCCAAAIAGQPPAMSGAGQRPENGLGRWPSEEPGRGRARDPDRVAGPRGVSRHGTFISPMGEPFRIAEGSGAKPPEQSWFEGADVNHDGRLSLIEMRTDALRFFKTLDLNHDGEIDPDEISHYETDVAPEASVAAVSRFGPAPSFDDPGNGAYDSVGSDITEGNLRVQNHHRGGGAGGRRGAGAYSYLDLPEPVISADRDFNRGVSIREFDDAAQTRFHLLDTDGKGYLTKEALAALR